MAARGLEVSPVGVARAYTPWLRRLLVDPRDHAGVPTLAGAGVSVLVADILMTDREREIALARRVLEAA
jgi:hypothetical protein